METSSTPPQHVCFKRSSQNTNKQSLFLDAQSLISSSLIGQQQITGFDPVHLSSFYDEKKQHFPKHQLFALPTSSVTPPCVVAGRFSASFGKSDKWMISPESIRGWQYVKSQRS
jgi:hypothetical protein